MNTERAIAYRKQAAALLQAVLEESVTARQAINTWPILGNEDPSVRCAYTMLWFFEADEDRHQEEAYYSDVQLQLLQETYSFLTKGEPLPKKRIIEYQGLSAPCEYTSQAIWRSPWWWIKSRLKTLTAILESNPVFHKHKKTPR